jgi:hypothetical protein
LRSSSGSVAMLAAMRRASSISAAEVDLYQSVDCVVADNF